MKPHLLSKITFSKKLFLSVLVLFYLFAGFFFFYQRHREKEFKIELINNRLQDYNKMIAETFDESQSLDSLFTRFINRHPIKNLRLTLINDKGNVLFDSEVENVKSLSNHANRPEVISARKKGYGFDFERNSATLNTLYFYSATKVPNSNYIIRSALPYSFELQESLKIDYTFLWWLVVITLLLTLFFLIFTQRLGQSISKLREFAAKADREESLDQKIETEFPGNELGDISRHIVTIYGRLLKTKEKLKLEREKLTDHLFMSQEGLAVFNNDYEPLIYNNLFFQYVNMISDSSISNIKEIFAIKELQTLINFIKNINKEAFDERKITEIIEKNGKHFSISCIVFLDSSFEISINDVTQEEEQDILKKQLTQNISHELKTPVSSIRGYMETILNNDNLDKETLKQFHERCYAQSCRLSNLLTDISTLTRLDEAKDLIHKETLNISTIVNDIIQELTLQIKEKEMTVRNNLPQQLIIQGNQSLIYSIFRNLTDNSIAYAGNGTTITIECFKQNENYYYFSFSDNGIGIEEEHLARIFGRFYRVDKGRSRKLGGTSLGLAIVKNAILFHGGSISAKKNPLGGIEFIFTLKRQA